MAEQKQQAQGVDVKTFIAVQSGALKAAKENLDRIFNDFSANLQNVVTANEALAKENEELKKQLKPAEETKPVEKE